MAITADDNAEDTSDPYVASAVPDIEIQSDAEHSSFVCMVKEKWGGGKGNWRGGKGK